MPILFNSLLEAENLDPADVRLLRHKDNKAAKGRGPYELWRDSPVEFDYYQTRQSLGNEAKLRASHWASFIGTPNNETLFVGLYAIRSCRLLEVDAPKVQSEGLDLAGSCNVYEISLRPSLNEFIGKLLVDWGPGGRAWIQRADQQNKTVTELRKEFKEPPFPGFLNFIKSLSELQQLPPAWIEALRWTKGVYLLTCPKTKEQYIGSASGGAGFWSRWKEYVETTHGGNVALKSRDPSDYQVSILEVAGSSSTDGDILIMEERWKRKLQSRDMGLNRN